MEARFNPLGIALTGLDGIPHLAKREKDEAAPCGLHG
jgi:hypothetical protein